MLGGTDHTNGELPSYITGANNGAGAIDKHILNGEVVTLSPSFSR